jgi:hypothetical protein
MCFLPVGGQLFNPQSDFLRLVMTGDGSAIGEFELIFASLFFYIMIKINIKFRL